MQTGSRRPLVLVTSLLVLVIWGVSIFLHQGGPYQAAALPQQESGELRGASRAKLGQLGEEPRRPVRDSAVVEAGTRTEEGARQGSLLVRDDRGRPVPEARVASWFGSKDSTLTKRSGVTDREGRWDFELPTGSQPLWLKMEKEGHFPIEASYRPLASLELTLPRSRPLLGRVIERESGRPLSEARVVFRLASKFFEPVEAWTDAAGGFRIEAVPIGSRGVLSVEAEGFAETTESFQPSEGADSAIDIELQRAVALRGRVVDAQTGGAVQGVTLWPRGEAVGQDGILTEELPPSTTGLIEAGFVAPGYLRSRGELDPQEYNEVPLWKAAALEGTVVDPEGQPLSGIGLRARRDFVKAAREGTDGKSEKELAINALGWRVGSDPYVQTASDENGRFRFEGLFPGSWYEVESTSEEWRPLRNSVQVSGSGEVSLRDFQLQAWPTVRQVEWKGTLRINGEPLVGRVSWQQFERRGFTQTQADGSFHFPEVPAGEIDLSITPADSAFRRVLSSRGESKRVVLQGEGLVELDVDLDLPLRTIEGHVVVAGTEEPVSGLWMRGNDGDRTPMVPGTTDDSGRFVLQVPEDPTNSWTVETTYGGQRFTLQDVRAGTRDLRLELPALGLVRLRVMEPGGVAPAKGWMLALRSSPDEPYRRWSGGSRLALDEQGWFVGELVQGTWDLLLRYDAPHRSSGGVVVTQSLQVTGGQERELQLEFPVNSLLTLHLNGPPLDLPAFLLVPHGREQEVREMLDSGRWASAGSFYEGTELEARCYRFRFDRQDVRLAHVGPGQWTILPLREGVRVEPEVLDIGQDAETTIDLTIE